MIVVFPKKLRVTTNLQTLSAASSKTKKSTKKSEMSEEQVIGFFYTKFKRPLNYLFALLKKPRKSDDDKTKIKSLLAGLRAVDEKFQKKYKLEKSILDTLISQRNLKLGKLEASFRSVSAKSSSKDKKGSEEKSEKLDRKTALGLFYNRYKKPLNYLFILMRKRQKSDKEKDTIKSILKGLRAVDKVMTEKFGQRKSLLQTLIQQRKIRVTKDFKEAMASSRTHRQARKGRLSI